MARRLILDTAILVGPERSGSGPVSSISPDDDVAIAAVTVAELALGIRLASAAQQPHRQRFVERILTSVPIIPYGRDEALAHADLLAAARHDGRTRGAHDLIIAATAVVTGRTVLTTDARAGCDGLPGVEAIVVPEC